MKTLRVILTLASFDLAACQMTSGGSGCPPLVTYSAETQRQAAQELRRLPPDSQLAKMIIHYGQMRKACRL